MSTRHHRSNSSCIYTHSIAFHTRIQTVRTLNTVLRFVEWIFFSDLCFPVCCYVVSRYEDFHNKKPNTEEVQHITHEI